MKADLDRPQRLPHLHMFVDLFQDLQNDECAGSRLSVASIVMHVLDMDFTNHIVLGVVKIMMTTILFLFFFFNFSCVFVLVRSNGS